MILVGRVTGGMKDESLNGTILAIDECNVGAIFFKDCGKRAHLEIDTGGKSGSVEIEAPALYPDIGEVFMCMPEIAK